MWVKFFCISSLVGVVCCTSVPYYRGLGKGRSLRSSSPFYELPCTQEGGLCLWKSDCPEGKQAAKGLCPLQQDLGVECCHAAGKNKCRRQGGECLPAAECPRLITFSGPTDCAHDESCCIWID